MLKLEKVSKSFGDVKAVEDITFEVENGEFVFITGASGAGKTTVIKLILREYLPDTGQIIIDGEDITKAKDKEIPKIRQQIGVVFQDFKVLSERTLRENIEVALAVAKVPQNEWKERVNHVLKLVGLMERGNFFPSQLAGGELQRTALARALVINPKVILADEPTGNLDWETADSIMDLFDKINKEGKTIIMATHHKGIIDKMKKRVIEIEKGKIVKDSGKKESHKEKPKEEVAEEK
ncbi:cell division ATP-binding protein FtsE [Candidatus Woesebacteria bacterium RIFCSPLOWO2_01_FULL_39_23]|uniref:Cell division ATP-binding protein FtsE n=1 Tax=Candidatus Woesebacteria bacterium RIFCSPHIGHO2_01_FULL_40_22 TaxID=1802499 RepID=A0A1F7YH31_9BACT|nr:MAG: cell division ATP-binding protein FtsE [Candidatus Woesebacteria bacterium RBG_16_40_11]OGM25825.1 MAG: cell division ATP-binding protein FtsE [Candidatus Woesebacteria bacterium RIFCSPHIGHO2_01_FULL_40_22]OGM61778.1 MAG: cell division ATP-binding protein FtsE [Candidatus Woesebacteria bacterium RIFCSPLOWO2_01_FULL_39_23]